ncbi:SpoIIE family protein phosphatase [Methanobrevibacter sp.]|uniref:SpoIIE family protein phosphatase n=1 Tax=Methanobrevibacter sp. TaxID=66852 RepID=UPI00388FC7BF
MLKKLFSDKKFIFIFTFIIEVIFYILFEHLPIGGEYLIPDIGLSPIFGLMFGYVGGLGFSLASVTCQLIEGSDPIGSLIDFVIMFFVSVLSYKLWYSTFKRNGISTPRFNSTYNLLKFITLMIIVSIVYWAMIEISFDTYNNMRLIYPLSTNITRFSYVLNMFNYSMIFGLSLINIFNIKKIPLQSPKKSLKFINIKYKYFIVSFIILIIYLAITKTLNIYDGITTGLFFILTIATSIIFCLNNFEVEIKNEVLNYSIIEKIILFFIVILFISAFLIFSELQIIIDTLINELNMDFIRLITLSFAIFMIIPFCILHIYFIEKTITNPIYDLIDSTTHYKAHKRLDESSKFNNFQKYLKYNNDISRLIESYITLDKNIENKLNDLEKTTAEKERIETEFNIASNIQTGMIKTDFDEFSNNKPFEIYGFMNPAKEVGGDFYDYFDIDDENIAFVIGDVSGKGVPATLFMVKTMYLIKNHSEFDSTPEEIFENVNNVSCDKNDENLFVTSWFGKLNLNSGKLSFVNAGHNPPLIRQNNRDFEYLASQPNFVLGGIKDIEYNEYELCLNPGDMIFLYTDGITEANDNYNGFYGENRLKTTINNVKDKKLEKIIETIKKDIYKFCNSNEQFDDMTMLIIKYNGRESHE